MLHYEFLPLTRFISNYSTTPCRYSWLFRIWGGSRSNRPVHTLNARGLHRNETKLLLLLYLSSYFINKVDGFSFPCGTAAVCLLLKRPFVERHGPVRLVTFTSDCSQPRLLHSCQSLKHSSLVSLVVRDTFSFSEQKLNVEMKIPTNRRYQFSRDRDAL